MIENGSAVLMARIVDSGGRTIRRADVAEIEYSIYERERRVVAGRDGVTLHVRDVLFDSLQNCGSWSVDAVGYNFRHIFNVPQKDMRATARKSFSVRYAFTSTIGQTVMIRFQLGRLSR